MPALGLISALIVGLVLRRDMSQDRPSRGSGWRDGQRRVADPITLAESA